MKKTHLIAKYQPSSNSPHPQHVQVNGKYSNLIFSSYQRFKLCNRILLFQPLCWVLATLAACVFAMEAQDLEAAEQFYHIHGVYYPAWSVAVPAAVPPAYAVGGQLASFSPDPDPEATTNKAAAPDSSGSDKKDQPQHDTTSKKDVRLPRTVLPIHYDVRLFPVLEKGNFSILGQVSIDLQCQMETDRIVLHSADIVVDPQSVKVFTAQYISSRG